MSGLLMERLQILTGLDPVADAFSGTVYSDVVDMAQLTKVAFVLHVGVGATGTSTITVEACDDTTPTNTSAVVFRYRVDNVGDEGAIATAAVAGFTTTAGSAKVVVVEVDERDLAATGYRYVRLKAVEVVDSPVLGGILIVGEAKDAQAAKSSAID